MNDDDLGENDDERIADVKSFISHFLRMKVKILRWREMHKMAASNFRNWYFALMVPAILICTGLCCLGAFANKDWNEAYRVMVTLGCGINSVLLSLVAFLNLQSSMELHLRSVQAYDNLFTDFEFEHTVNLLEESGGQMADKLKRNLEEARRAVLRTKQQSPPIPAWISGKLLPAGDADQSDLDRVINFEIKDEELKDSLKSELAPLKHKLAMEQRKKALEANRVQTQQYPELVSEITRLGLQLGTMSDQERQQQTQDLSARVVMLLSQCKTLYDKKEQNNGLDVCVPLADAEYDSLKSMYARFHGIETSVVERQFEEFRLLKHQLDPCARLLALRTQFKAAVHTLPHADYQGLTEQCRRAGTLLTSKLDRLAHDPILSSGAASSSNCTWVVHSLREIEKDTTCSVQDLVPMGLSDKARKHLLMLIEVAAYSEFFQASMEHAKRAHAKPLRLTDNVTFAGKRESVLDACKHFYLRVATLVEREALHPWLSDLQPPWLQVPSAGFFSNHHHVVSDEDTQSLQPPVTPAAGLTPVSKQLSELHDLSNAVMQLGSDDDAKQRVQDLVPPKQSSTPSRGTPSPSRAKNKAVAVHAEPDATSSPG